MATIAHLGTGLLGAAMVERHLALGASVVVWNRTASKTKALEAKGARVAASVADAVKGAERVHIALSDDAAVDALLPEVLKALAPGAWVIDHTTTSVFGVRDRYARMEAEKVAFVHAPVFMTPAMARDAKGMILLSGPREQWERLRPILEPMTGELWYVGARPGEAAAYKLFGNAMILVVSAGTADLFAMARGMGLEPHDAIGVFERFMPGVHARASRMANADKDDFAPSFELTMARKDLRLALEAAERSGLPLAVLPALAKRFDDVIAAGNGGKDYSVIATEALAAGARGDDEDPFAQLERCHRRLEERLTEFAGALGDPAARTRLFDFLDRSIRRHEEDEEQSLFPRLANRLELTVLIASLKKEHELQNERQRALREAKTQDEIAAALKALTDGYRLHLEKEEKALFPAARQLLDAEATKAVAREMQARRGHEGEGRGGRERGRGGGGGGGGGGGAGGGGGGGGGGGRRG